MLIKNTGFNRIFVLLMWWTRVVVACSRVAGTFDPILCVCMCMPACARSRCTQNVAAVAPSSSSYDHVLLMSIDEGLIVWKKSGARQQKVGDGGVELRIGCFVG